MTGQSIDAFITRWEAASGAERANYQLFLTEFCTLLGLPMPDPAREDTRDNAYVFARRVTFRHGDGTESPGFADLYRRGHFVLEAKKIRKEQGKAFDDTMLRARGQAEQYGRARTSAAGGVGRDQGSLDVHLSYRIRATLEEAWPPRSNFCEKSGLQPKAARG